MIAVATFAGLFAVVLAIGVLHLLPTWITVVLVVLGLWTLASWALKESDGGREHGF